jgi:predicted nucleic acid-binding protein
LAIPAFVAYRFFNNLQRVNARHAFDSDPRLPTLPMSVPIAKEAARLRAKHNLRTPDSIQMATVINTGATSFLINDVQLAGQ